jgi:AraC-like DNA-binding protein
LAIGIFDSGIGGTFYKGARECIGPGEIVVINADEVHTGYPADGRPLTYRMLYIGGSFFQDTLAFHRGLPRFPSIRIPNADLASRLRQAHLRLRGQVGIVEETGLIETLGAIVSLYGDAPLRSPFGSEPAAIRTVREYLRSNFRRNIRIAELAALVGLDRAYLIRSFRRAVGMPPHEWLLQVRVEEAKRLLLSGQAIADIATSLGFADQSHLTRRFKSVTGMSPGQYMRSHFRSRRISLFR